MTVRGDDGCALFASVLRHGPAVVLLHGGGPDRWSLRPLARMLAQEFTVVLPDIRGYGQSVCLDPARHTWGQYTDDLLALLDHLGVQRAVIGGSGLGSTVAMRAAVAYPTLVIPGASTTVEHPSAVLPLARESGCIRSDPGRELVTLSPRIPRIVFDFTQISSIRAA
jgi:pimeloyl-ACP methyl ester carboxylesterase